MRLVDSDLTLLTLTPDALGRTTDFWTPKILSSRVQVVVEAKRRPEGLSFTVSALAYPRQNSQLLSIFGRKPNYLHLLDDGQAKVIQAARAVARLDFIAEGESKSCTGFLISSRRLLTNHHCISSQEVCGSTWVTFDHHKATDGVTQGPAYRCKELLAGNGGALAGLDAAVIEVYGDPSADGRTPLAFAAGPADPSQELVMIHHPGAEPMRVSRKGCQVRTVQAPGEGGQLVDFSHRCDSKPGSSGAPILNAETRQVVGLHHWGFQTWGPFMRENRAVRVEHIRPLMP